MRSLRPRILASMAIAASFPLFASVASAQTLNRSFSNFPSNLRSNIKHIIVIYPENRSFDSLYGFFPGANGLQQITDGGQFGRADGTHLNQLIQPNTNGISLFGSASLADARFPSQMPNAPYDTSLRVTDSSVIGDMTHLFYLEQYQINNPVYGVSADPKNAGGPTMSKFTVWSSNPGLVLSYYDEYSGGEGSVARNFVLADNAFHSAFGGSFLNHQWLIAARSPIWPASPSEGGLPVSSNVAITPKDAASTYDPVNNPNGQWWPAANGSSNGYGATLSDNALTNDPTLPGFSYSNANQTINTGDYWAVNTLRPLRGPAGGYSVPASGPYLNIADQMHGKYLTYTVDTNGNASSTTAVAAPVSSTAVNSRLPLQYHDTIGDRLNDAGVSWAWFSGGWKNAKNGYADFLFQFHHQPFAFFAKYALAQAPVYPANGSTTAPTPGVDSFDPDGKAIGYGIGSANHLLDEDADFYPMLEAGTLPAVSFVKPIGEDNSHPGYASVKRGQAWVANIVAKIQASPIWKDTVIFICYDEHGGLWDHVTPPVVDRWGPGLRIPFIIASPYSKRGYVDHNQYETVSILSFIEGLYNLPPLSTRDANALPPVAAFVNQPDLFLETKVGQSVSYKIPAYNQPNHYAASVSNGLSLDPNTGLITGVPVNAGTTVIPVTVTGTGSPATLRYQLQIDVKP